MPNRVVSFAVLLFSLAITLMTLQPPAGAAQHFYILPTVTLPVLFYRILGSIATAGSLFFIVVAFRKQWREKVEEWVTYRSYSYYPGFMIFWLVYTIAYLKGIGAIMAISPPAWIVYLVFYFGFALFLAIPTLSFINWPAWKKTPQPHATKNGK